MTEALFQFIWQHSLYSITDLKTVDGDILTVVHPGKLNRDAGPDFLEARVKIGTTILVGNIELHLKSSDWQKHGHQNNGAYNNLILHVVHEDDVPAVAPNIATVSLSRHIPESVIRYYDRLMQVPGKLPCAGQLHTVKDITREGWLSRLLAERWEEKLSEWNILLEHATEDWRNLFYWRMAANFGFKTNATPFLLLAQSLPLNVLGRHRTNLTQVEALLFGQAGMLEGEFSDAYPVDLKNEYTYLKKKYKLNSLAGYLWKFLRMRPANFPTVRIAQFAMLIHQSEHLFSQVIETHTIKDIAPLLNVAASSYWDSHFRFDEVHDNPAPKSLGKTSVQNIIINTIAPIQFLYASKQGKAELREESLALLETVPPEKNNITTIWSDHGWEAANAAQSQAMIQLYNRYCSGRKCLNCTIGLNIIRQAN